MKDLQLVYHDRPVSAAKEMVHWVEHVVKTRGAKHLRSLALITPWYQKYFVDLAVLILVSLVVFVILIKKTYPVVKKHTFKLLASKSYFSNRKLNVLNKDD